METQAFERTQRCLATFLAYLEGIHSSMDWDAQEAEAPVAGGQAGGSGEDNRPLPPRLERILSDCGYLEGMSLKARGCLSSDLQEFIMQVGMAFEMEAAPQGVFKLPFVDGEIAFQRKTLNPFMEKAWMTYHAALLSSYALKPLRFERLPSESGGHLEGVVRLKPDSPGRYTTETSGGLGPESVHRLNNSLSGIAGFVSLMMEERKNDKDLQEKLGLVLEAAKKSGEELK